MWIEKLPNGKYKYFERYKDPYTEKWKRVSITLDSGSNRAKKEAQKLLDDKIFQTLDKLKTTDRTFNSVLEDWWEIYQNQVRRASVTARTPAYRRLLENFAPETPIRNIDKAYVKKFLVNSGYTKAQLVHIKAVLNGVFDHAEELKMISSNPSKGIELPRKSTKIGEIKPVTEKFLEPVELELLLQKLYNNKNTYRAGLLAEFMSLNGCRIGEAVALQMGNYDKEKREIHIHGTLDSMIKHAEKEMTKTNSSYRTVFLSEREIQILDEIIKLNRLEASTNPNWPKTDFIFLNNRGYPIQRNSFNASLKNANKKLNPPIPKQLSSHIFRHTLVSMLAEKRIPAKAIMARVGHSDSKTTSEIYTHVTQGMKNDIADVLDRIALGRTHP